MAKKTNITEHDIHEFRKSIKGVKPLQHNKVILTPKVKTKSYRPTLDFSDNEYAPTVSAETVISFARPGLQTKIIRKLRQGRFPIEAELDLHGMTTAQAKTALIHFLTECQQRQLRVVQIIHGKSRYAEQPVLKNKVNQWLRQSPSVLAFHSAKSTQGGTGALQVLLKGENL